MPRSPRWRRLTRFEGHLLNWYDTRTLAPLAPRYVSAVDSGNLAASLLTLAAGLRQIALQPEAPVDLPGLEEVTAQLHRAIIQSENLKVVELPEPRPLKEAVWNIRATLASSATDAQKVERLAGPLETLDAVTAEFDAAKRDFHDSEVAHWTRQLQRDISATIRPAPLDLDRLNHVAQRAITFADSMNFRLLYDEQRGLLSIGYRMADAEGPGRLDKRALRPARIRSAAGQLPRESRRATSPRHTGSGSAGRLLASAAHPLCSRGARRCSST